MFDLLVASSNFDGSDSNFTNPFNVSSIDLENGNASRHFADVPQTSEMIYSLPMLIIASLSFLPCLFFVIFSLFWFTNCQKFRIVSRSREESNEAGSLAGSCRPDLLSIVQHGVATDQMIFQHGHQIPIVDTPSSIYPSDMLPGYSDSSRNLHSDTITTPISNNSIITMTMRNNYLIVETEERVPVDRADLLSSEELYKSTLPDFSHYSQLERIDFASDDLMDDYHHCYLEDDDVHNFCSTGECGDRQAFYEASSSRQVVDEEEQRVELFHKNILAFPSTSSSFEHGEAETVADFYGYDNNGMSTSSYGAATADHAHLISKVKNVAETDVICLDDTAAPKTGFTQSDLSGSSTSTPRIAQSHYIFSSQCEYEDCELPPQRKRASSLKLY